MHPNQSWEPTWQVFKLPFLNDQTMTIETVNEQRLGGVWEDGGFKHWDQKSQAWATVPSDEILMVCVQGRVQSKIFVGNRWNPGDWLRHHATQKQRDMLVQKQSLNLADPGCPTCRRPGERDGDSGSTGEARYRCHHCQGHFFAGGWGSGINA